MMNNEPAFPYTAKTLVGWANDGTPNHIEDTHPGMTLRDYFAAKAMQMQAGHTREHIAAEAYRLADAMLAERNKA